MTGEDFFYFYSTIMAAHFFSLQRVDDIAFIFDTRIQGRHCHEMDDITKKWTDCTRADALCTRPKKACKFQCSMLL